MAENTSAPPVGEQPRTDPSRDPEVAARPAAALAPAAAAVVSRFGEIAPGFAAAFGASVEIGLHLGARNAQERAFSGAARHRPRQPARRALAIELPTVRQLPRSRVGAALQTEVGVRRRGEPE